MMQLLGGLLKAMALGSIVVMLPAGRTLLAQETVQVPTHWRPAWVVDGVPDSVWILVEASAATDREDHVKALLKQAEAHARAALEDHGDDVRRRFALAVVLGLRANGEGGRTKVSVASDLHRELEAILEADSDHARARHMMGRLHAGVRRMNGITRWIATNLLGGGELKKATWEEAERNLTFAERLAPEVSEHHLQLAHLYSDTDRPELAFQELEHVFQLPAASPMELAAWDEALELRDQLSSPTVRRSTHARARGGRR